MALRFEVYSSSPKCFNLFHWIAIVGYLYSCFFLDLNIIFVMLQELANLSTLELIENDGSPSSEKLFVLWNPALCLRTVGVFVNIVVFSIELVLEQLI